MEITHNKDLDISIAEFKIDLIVWKYLNDIKRSIHVVMFKIDLIVWKLAIHTTRI